MLTVPLTIYPYFRKHSTNFKCDKDGCSKTFAKQYQVTFFELFQGYIE